MSDSGRVISRTASPSEWLDAAEAKWAPQLRDVSLVCEVDVKRPTVLKAAQALGMVYRQRIMADRFRGMFERWPACVVIAMTGVARLEFKQHTFWPEWWDACGWRGNDMHHREWGSAYIAALRSLDLPLSTSGQAYLGSIVMHAGIPAYCLEDLLRLLLQRKAQDPGLDAAAFFHWATAGEHRLHGVDEPVRRFLLADSEYAHDVLDRCIDLLDRLTEPEPDLDAVGLPSHIVEAAQKLAEEGKLTLERSAAERGSSSRCRSPQVGLDPFGYGVQLILPRTGAISAEVTEWTINADGVRSTVRSQSAWVGVAEEAPPTTYPLSQPVRMVRVQSPRLSKEVTLQVIDPAEPWLIFTEDGRRLPAGRQLPLEAIWVLYPDDLKLDSDTPLREMAEGRLPLGWNGWRLVLLSMEGRQWLGLAGREFSRRAVRGRAQPRLITGEPLVGVTTPYGSAVHADLPEIWLPAESQMTWHVEIRRVGGPVVFSRSYTVDQAASVKRMWETVERPILGAFEITVRGSIGRGMRRTVFIAEGLSVSYTPEIRLFTEEGLVSGRSIVVPPEGGKASPAEVSFTAHDVAEVIEYRAGDETEPLVVTPPHAQVLLQNSTEPATWSAGPVQLTAESLEDGGTLLLRIPAVDDSEPLHLVSGGADRQLVEVSGRQNGTGRYNLARLADTVRSYPHAQLVATVKGQRFPVAHIRPMRLASYVEHHGEILRLGDPAHVEGLTAGIYLATAPWREPITYPIEADGTVSLPPALQNAGPMIVHLRIEDPWVQVDWPRWPDYSAAFVCANPGVYPGDDPEEETLARYMAGYAKISGISRLDRLWTLIDLADHLRFGPGAAKLVADCSAELRNSPLAALRALRSVELNPGRAIVVLIDSGFAALAPESHDDEETTRELWSFFPAAAVLLSTAQPVGEWTLHAEDQCGDSLVDILDGGDPHIAVGRFGPGAEQLAALPPEQQDMAIRASGCVPAALLDERNRAFAAHKLLGERETPQAANVARESSRILRRARHILAHKHRSRDLLHFVEERRHPEGKGGWLALPAVSLGLALIARLAARGDDECVAVEREFRCHWRLLAEVAPDFITIDLVLAELLLVSQDIRSAKPLT
ncbi:hypothetical protein GCM10010466_08510 [Planomonospora alba]|uniref:Uncharacterized protein n=1 Tax=Planomonospora alba TaxID=161354 RepID=A0ABP6MMX8_9ACTN